MKRGNYMNELEKAIYFLTDKNISLIDISKKYGIPYQTLRNLRSNPQKIKKASWSRVHLLAKLYDEQEKEFKMTDALINKDEIAIANFVIQTAKKIHIEVGNLELNSIMAVLEGWSFSEYGKTLCNYDVYFKYGTMHQILLPSVYDKFRRYGSEPITYPYQDILALTPEIKVNTPTVTKKDFDWVDNTGSLDVNGHDVELGNSTNMFDRFNTHVQWCLFYHRLTGEVIMPMLKNFNLKSDSSYLDQMPTISQNTLAYIYDHNWGMIKETGLKLAQSYKSNVQSGFPPEIINDSDGQDLIESFRKYYSTVNDTPTGDVYRKLITLFNQAYQLGKHKKDLSDLKFSCQDETFTDILSQAYKLGKNMREWQDFLNYDDDEDCF